MTRAINFDINQVISNAMQTFWDHGSKTTMNDVEVATGLNRSSLYNTFGNKEELFRLAMNCYVDFLEKRIEQTHHHSFKEFIKYTLDDASTNNFEGRGCFFYNCLGTKLSKKNKVVLDSAYVRLKEIFQKRIRLAQEHKELGLNISPSAYATLMMATISGLRAFNLSGLPKEDLQDAASLALDKLVTF